MRSRKPSMFFNVCPKNQLLYWIKLKLNVDIKLTETTLRMPKCITRSIARIKALRCGRHGADLGGVNCDERLAAMITLEAVVALVAAISANG